MGTRWLLVCLICAACGDDTSNAGPDGGTGDAGADGGGPVVMGGDPTFGDHGLATFNLGGGISGLTAISHQSTGKIVAVGATQEAMVVLRTTATGEADPSFGNGGSVDLPFGLPANGISNNQDSIAVQPDDKIVIAGTLPGGVYAQTFHTVIARLTPDGALDATFGTGGVVLSPDNLILNKVVLLPDGHILVGGGAVARYNADGTLDTTFGTNGSAFPPGGATAFAVATDGSIVCAGDGLSKLTASGTVDTTFGTNGRLQLPNPTFENQLLAIAIQSDGKILAGGAIATTGSGGSQPPFALIRASAAGVLDPTFGGGDGIADDGSTQGGLAEGIAITAGGILAIGPSKFGGTNRSCVRLDDTGALDATFDCNAGVTLTLGGPHVLDDGSFLVPGASLSGFSIGMALAKVAATGGNDPSFGFASRAEGGSFDRAQALALQPDGSVLVGGWSEGNTGNLLRLTANGELDTSFGTSGATMPDSSLEMEFITNIAVQPSGKIVALGTPLKGAYVAERFDASGQIDPSFGTAGLFDVSSAGSESLFNSRGMAVAADGSLYIVGEGSDAARMAGQYCLMHVGVDGAVDTTYGTSGLAITAFTDPGDNIGKFVSVAPDGSAVVLGLENRVPTLVRFDATGALDATFGPVTFGPSGQTVVAEVYGLVRQDDGKLVAVAGNSITGELDVLRIGADGTPDPGFGTAGVATIQLGGANDYQRLLSPMGVALDKDGKLLVGVSVAADQTLIEQAAIVRLGTDGAPDASWGTAGVEAVNLGDGSSTLHALLFQPDGKLLAAGRRWTTR